jgi:hypothetical protein
LLGLQLMEAHHVRSRCRQPSEQIVEPPIDVVDFKRGDLRCYTVASLVGRVTGSKILSLMEARLCRQPVVCTNRRPALLSPVQQPKRPAGSLSAARMAP